MLAWVLNNIAAIIICAVLIIITAAIIVNMVKDKKSGKSSCGCGCSDCPMNNSCHTGK